MLPVHHRTAAIDLLEEALAVWRDCPASLPPLGRSFSAAEQSALEARLERFIGAIERELHVPPLTRSERQAVHERISAAFAEFGRGALGLDDSHFKLLLGGGLSAVGTRLAREARRFDPAVSVADIFQANRNAWTACGLQMLFGRGMCLTPSIFAYSMLYPYTDNYLDDPAIPAAAKRGFSRRFGLRLAGDGSAAANHYEEAVWRLVELIEGQYSRAGYPRVFESLLRIHRTQEDSLRLLHGGLPKSGADAVDVLRISFEKGGASVLADGYLAAGTLTPEQARFAFSWGVLLQLADDLQDVAEDRQSGVLTLFSRAAGQEPLDALTNRTLHFGRAVMLQMHALPAATADGREEGDKAPEEEEAKAPEEEAGRRDDARALRQLIEKSCLSLLIRSVGEAASFYTPDCLEILEAHSPFRFAFLSQRRRQLAKRSTLLTRLFEAFLAGEEDEPAFPWLPSSLMPR